MEEIQNLLKGHRCVFRPLAITTAKVPIVKFEYGRNKNPIQVDMSLYNMLGIRNTELLRAYSLLDPRVRVSIFVNCLILNYFMIITFVVIRLFPFKFVAYSVHDEEPSKDDRYWRCITRELIIICIFSDVFVFSSASRASCNTGFARGEEVRFRILYA